MFENAREKYKDTEYKMLVAKLIDKYEIAKNNYKNSQEHRKELQRRYIVLQQKIIEL